MDKPWQKFEQLVVDSTPRQARCLRLHTPTPFRPGSTWAARFTSKPPYDLEISVPHPLHVKTFDDRLITPSVSFCFDMKSCGESRLAFSRVKKHQVDGLLKARDHGCVAGLLVEWRGVGSVSVAVFYPIGEYVSYVARAQRSSLPASVEGGILVPWMSNGMLDMNSLFKNAGGVSC